MGHHDLPASLRYVSRLVILASLLTLPQTAIAQVDSPEIRKAIAALQDQDVDVRAKAARQLGQLGTDAIVAADPLIQKFSDSEITSEGDRVSQIYAQAVGNMGSGVVEPLMQLFENDNPLVLASVCEALHRIGPEAASAIPELAARLPKAQGDQRWGIVYILVGIGPAAAPTVPNLIPLLSDSDFQLQIVTCRALAAIGPEAAAAVPELLQRLVDGNGSVKSHAALALGAIGPQPNHDIPAAIAKLIDEEQYVIRERALEALAKLGPAAQSTLPQLERYWNAQRFNAMIPLCVTRWKITQDPAPSLERLKTLAEAPETELEAIHAVAQFGAAAEPAISWLVPKLASEDGDVAYEAAMALAAIGQAKADVLEGLGKLTQSEDEFAAEGAAEAIKQLKEKAAGDRQ